MGHERIGEDQIGLDILELLQGALPILGDPDAEGPLFLANLPVGRYEITAVSQGVSQARSVDIGGERSTKAVFQWPGYAMD